jgi:hypothetical protein
LQVFVLLLNGVANSGDAAKRAMMALVKKECATVAGERYRITNFGRQVNEALRLKNKAAVK